jgi:hypothetical protein
MLFQYPVERRPRQEIREFTRRSWNVQEILAPTRSQEIVRIDWRKQACKVMRRHVSVTS